MDWTDFATAVALLLIFEGLMPFANPEGWKNFLKSIQEFSPSIIRQFGFFSMMTGLLILYWLN